MRNILILCCLFCAQLTYAQLKVVTSFSILQDIAQQIGQEKVVITSLVGADQDAHHFEPTPKHIQQLTHADIFIINGLDFEGWLTRIVDASGFKGTLVIATKGIDPIHSQGEDTHKEAKHDHHSHDDGHDHSDHHHHHHHDIDPHAWHDPNNVMIYAQNIAQAFIDKDPNNASFYQENLAQYLAELRALDEWAKSVLSDIPEEKRNLLVRHDAFSYLGRAYHINFIPVLGITASVQPSAKDLVKIGELIKEKDIRLMLTENIVDDRLLVTLVRDHGVMNGGLLLSDALSAKHADNYLSFFRYNMNQISRGFKKANVSHEHERMKTNP